MEKLLILFLFIKNPVYQDKIVAIVDKKAIFKSDIEEALEFFRILKPEITKQEEKLLRDKILDELIRNELILYEAKKDTTLFVDEREVEEYLENELLRLKTQMGDSLYKEELKKSGLSEEELKEKYREEIERNIYIQKYIGKYIMPHIDINEEKLKEFYSIYIDSIPEMPEGFELAHIFIPLKPSEQKVKAAEEKIWKIYKELEKGSDFGYMALKYSDDRASAQMGGDIGYVRRGTLPPEVEEKIFSLKEGEISKPIKGDLGYFIFQCVRKGVNEIHLRQIVVAAFPDKGDSLKVKQKAYEAYRFAKEKGFEEAVKKFSEDKFSKERGGYLGFIPIENLKEELKNKLLSAEDGDIIEPVFMDIGYHIFKRISYKKGGKPSFEEVRDRLYNLMVQKEIQRMLKEKAEKIKKRVYIKIYGF